MLKSHLAVSEVSQTSLKDSSGQMWALVAVAARQPLMDPVMTEMQTKTSDGSPIAVHSRQWRGCPSAELPHCQNCAILSRVYWDVTNDTEVESELGKHSPGNKRYIFGIVRSCISQRPAHTSAS